MKNERKEELKDEMKNRISLALKDPILQQGFEIICKENAELKHQLEHRNCLDCSNHSSNLRMRNLDLEKENAELKEKLKPENCRWVTTKVQNNNKTNNRLVSYNGRTQNVKQWCDELKLNYRITMRRLYEYHWSVKDAFEYGKVK